MVIIGNLRMKNITHNWANYEIKEHIKFFSAKGEKYDFQKGGREYEFRCELKTLCKTLTGIFREPRYSALSLAQISGQGVYISPTD